MPAVHDPATHTALRSRVQALRPDADRRWGKMTVDQMLWHVNAALCAALGQSKHEAVKPPPIPKPLFRFMVVNLPWPKGAPTHPDFVAGQRYDFEAEKARCLELIDTFAKRSVDSPWPDSPIFGPVTGSFMTRVQAKHIDHHLKQFGA